MKKIKLYFLLAAALFAGSTMAQTTIFQWGDTAKKSETAIIGTIAVNGCTFENGNKIESNTRKAYGIKCGNGLKIEGKPKVVSSNYIKIIPASGAFLKGDTVFYSFGYNSDKSKKSQISVLNKAGDLLHSGDTALNTKLNNGLTLDTCVLEVDADSLFLGRYPGETSVFVYYINVVRPAACTDAELSLPENPDIEVNEGKALTAPALTNPNNVAVTYASSNESVVTVAADGTLTSVGAGDAVITISSASQKVDGVLYCADELTYNVKIKSTAPVLEATESALDFSLGVYQPSKSASFTVSGYNLTGEASVSTLPDGFTLDPAKLTITDGAVDQAFTLTYTADAAVEASNANLVFTVGTTSVTIALTYGKKAALTQTTVTDSTTWNWSKAGIKEVQLDSTKTTPTRLDTFVLANIDGIANNANFNSQALLVRGQYMVRESKYFQGDYISFNVENAGTVKVEFSNTGNRTNAATETRYLYVNGAKTASGSLKSDANVTSEEIAVPAGKVEITFMLPDEKKGNQYGRVYKVTYRVKEDVGAAVEQSQVEAKAVKVIRDGQLLIIREGKTYTAQGVQVQ